MPTTTRKEMTAQAPRAPRLSPGMQKVQAEWEAYRREREGAERRSALRGSVLLALLVLLVSLLRAGADRAFYTGWWRQW